MRTSSHKPAIERDQWISFAFGIDDAADLLDNLSHVRRLLAGVLEPGDTPALDALEAHVRAFHDRPNNRELARKVPLT